MRSNTAAIAHEENKALPNERVRLAILGGGAVTWEFYLPALARLDGVDLITIVEPSAAARERLQAAGYHGPVDERSAEAFLGDKGRIAGIDAVIVALPNALHEPVVLSAFAMGKHVLCEKPLALQESACRRMAQAAQKAERRLAVGMVRRRSAAVVALRDALSADLAGRIEAVEIEDGESYQWMSESGAFFHPSSGGVLADMGVHHLDLVQSLFGELKPQRYTDDFEGGCEANVDYELSTAAGFPVRLKLSRDRKLANQLVVLGKKGKLILEKNNFETCLWFPNGAAALRAELTADKPFDRKEWPRDFTSAFSQQLSEFVEAVRGKGWRCPTVEEATTTTALLEWAYSHRAAPMRVSSKDTVWKDSQIFLTGGSGFIGGRLIARLSGLGCGKIKVPVRNYRTCVEAARFAVELPKLNLLDREAVRAAVKDCRFVFHLAYGREGDEAKRVTVEGTRNVVLAAIEAKAEAVVVLSTMSVFGHPSTTQPVDESWPYAPEGDYGRSKVEMEKLCLQLAQKASGTRVVVLNPSCVYGPLGKTYTRLPLELANERQFAWVDGGRGIANYVYVENLIDACLRAAEVREAHGQRFLITDGSCEWRQFLSPLLGPLAEDLADYSLKDLQQLAGSDRAGLTDLAKAVLRAREVRDVVSRMPRLGAAKRWLGKNFPALKDLRPRPSASSAAAASSAPPPPAWLGELFGPTVTHFQAESARRVLGWTPKISLEEGLRLTVSWLEEMNLFSSTSFPD